MSPTSSPPGSAGVVNGSYTSAYVDSRQRGRVSIAHVLAPTRAAQRAKASRGVPEHLVFSTILAKSLLALAAHLAREWLLGAGAHLAVVAANLWLLAIAGALLTAWTRPWTVIGSHRIRVGALPLALQQQQQHAPVLTLPRQAPLVLLYGALACAESLALLTAIDRLSVVRWGTT